MKKHTAAVLCVAALGLSGIVRADITTEISSSPAGPATTNAATGLNGSVYNASPQNASFFAGGGGPDSSDGLTNIQGYIAGNTANGQYTATSFAYNANDGTPTNTFLALDSNGTAASNTTHINSSIFDANGYVNIPTAGTYNFGITGSDDGAYILIAGNLVTAVGGAHGQEGANGVVTFDSPGQFPIEILYANQQYGGSSTSDGGGGASFTYVPPSGTSLFTTVQTPEPASLGLMGLASLGILARRRAR